MNQQKKQHAKDVKEFENIKAHSIEENAEFVEFLHTKGIKAKYRLVIENIKKGAKEAPKNTAKQIANIKVQTKNSITDSKPSVINTSMYTEENLQNEFNEFLKLKGFDDKYTVSIIEE